MSAKQPESDKGDSRQVRVSEAVFDAIRKQAEPFESVDTVLRRILNLPPRQ